MPKATYITFKSLDGAKEKIDLDGAVKTSEESDELMIAVKDLEAETKGAVAAPLVPEHNFKVLHCCSHSSRWILQEPEWADGKFSQYRYTELSDDEAARWFKERRLREPERNLRAPDWLAIKLAAEIDRTLTAATMMAPPSKEPTKPTRVRRETYNIERGKYAYDLYCDSSKILKTCAAEFNNMARRKKWDMINATDPSPSLTYIAKQYAEKILNRDLPARNRIK